MANNTSNAVLSSITATVRERLDEARERAQEAEAQYRKDALAAMRGDLSAVDLATSQNATGHWRAKVREFEAVLAQARSEDADADAKARATMQRKDDHETWSLFVKLTDDAKRLEAAAIALRDAWVAFNETADKARGAINTNPRAPRHLQYSINTASALRDELARLLASHPRTPNIPASSQYQRDSGAIHFTPIGDKFTEMAKVVRDAFPSLQNRDQ